MCEGPGCEKSALHRARTSQTLKDYWASPEGMERRRQMSLQQREVSRLLRQNQKTARA